VQREFSPQSVLVALYRIDFVHSQIEFKGQAVSALTWSPGKLELGVGERTRPNVELGIKVVGVVDDANPAETVDSPHAVAVSPIVQRGSGVRHVTEDERLVGLVLEAHVDVDELQTTLRAGAKVSNSRGKVSGFIAERLAAAERALGRARNGRSGLSLSGSRHSQRSKCEQNGHNAKNPKNRWS
jgi:hypothetical protein